MLSRPHGRSAARKIRPIEKTNDLIGNRTRDLSACSIVPQSNYQSWVAKSKYKGNTVLCPCQGRNCCVWCNKGVVCNISSCTCALKQHSLMRGMSSIVLEATLSGNTICTANIFRSFDITTTKTTLHEFKLNSYISIYFVSCKIYVFQFNRTLKKVNLAINQIWNKPYN
jgi:hypothetical protein